jgi:predicted enzyme related to lactoylglutathione lyase
VPTRFALALVALAALASPTPALAAAPATAAAPVAWFEIPVTNTARAKRFYQGVFGWSFQAMPEYGYDAWRIRTGTPGLEGVFTSQIFTVKTNGPVVFMRVPDMETALLRAIAMGGAIERPRTAVSPAFGSYVVVRDPDKNAIGLLGPTPRKR